MSCGCNNIALFRGDDYDFLSQRRVEIAISSDLDLTGCSAHFALLGYQQNFAPISDGSILTLKFPSSATSAFPLGLSNGRIWLQDAEGRIRTAANAIHFLVTNKISEAYPPDADPVTTIAIKISSSVSPTSYNALSDKPQINGVTLEGAEVTANIRILSAPDRLDLASSDGEFRSSFASLWSRFGGTVLDEGRLLAARSSSSVNQPKTGTSAMASSAHSYNSLTDKPSINGVTLVGNLVTADLRILTSADRLDLAAPDWLFRSAVATLWSRLGGTVIEDTSI